MKKYSLFTSKEISPKGWLRKQLEIQAQGLSGNLDKIWPDVRDSAWIGGNKEGWERVPYWLDGFIPLAYLTENQDMISRAKKYIDAIIAQQKEDGWICPCPEDQIYNYDTWAVLLITKVLVVYYECSGDERIPDVIYRTLKNYYEVLTTERVRLFTWGEFRWFEGMIAINFIKERYNDEWITELAKILKSKGADYANFVETWKRPLNVWTLHTHIVNLGMMLKEEAVTCDLLGSEYTDKAEYLREILDKYNGTPVGLFTGDECLSGLSPIQGTELCAVVEQMYSYELLYAYTGDKKWAERLELLAFNALPATISDDMWTHQYLQMSNQINCIRFPGRALFRTNGPDSHIFGLEPHYGCCTANFNQGWPKFALAAFMGNDKEIVSAVPVPSCLDCELAKIDLETDYPFKNEFKYTVDAKKNFSLKIRIPAFAIKPVLDGKAVNPGEEITLDFSANERRIILLTYNTKPELVDRPHDLKCVQCGSLVFSLPIDYEKRMHEYAANGVERKFPYCDYEYVAKSDWNYAYSDSSFEKEELEISDTPFSSATPPVVVKAKVKQIDWGLEDGFETVCAKVPESREAISEEKEIKLYPYGCAKLRMTELPLID